MLAPTQRFSSRVDNYVRYRPSYPPAVAELLCGECGLNSITAVADIGSGTGKLTEQLLPCAGHVFGVEPNQEMREAGARRLKFYSHFSSVPGTAEETTLPNQSVDIVVAGQAFHWFDRERCRAEFQRILKSGGWVALIWNDRRTETTPFLSAYEMLLREFATDYEQVNHRNIDAVAIQKFFHTEVKSGSIPHAQQFDFEGLKGRLLSSSYAPEAGQPKHDVMLARLQEIFVAHQQKGQVTFDYDTLIYYGKLA